MLKLREEQVAAMVFAARERYIRGVIATLPDVFPEDPAVHDGPAMHALVTSAIGRAAAYGIHDDREVTLFVYLLHELGEEVDRTPWIVAILRSEELAAAEKMNAIYDRLEQRA